MDQYRIVPRDGRDILGEGPCRSAARNVLFWVDIMAPVLRGLDPVTGAVRSVATIIVLHLRKKRATHRP
jgi:sugar lactone lactonase YvrE